MDAAGSKSPKRLATHQQSSVITEMFLEKFETQISKPNSLSSRHLYRKYEVANTDYLHGYQVNLRGTVKSKVWTHELSAKQVLQR
jgi:hypothetical protein